MPVPQPALPGVLDAGALDAVEARLVARERARHAAFADALRDALELERQYDAAGLWLVVPAQLALVWGCSEARAMTALTTAHVLVELPGALELLDDAVMTSEQAAAVGRSLDPLEPAVRQAVWARAAARLRADAQQGVHRPPARLTELLRTWAVQVDPEVAVERRRSAEADGNVLVQRRDDGLADVWLSGLSVPLADAVLSRVSAAAVPFGVDDDRSVGRRRLDAAVDLLLGRTGRPTGACGPVGGAPSADARPLAEPPTDAGTAPCGGCGCPLGASVPCGSQVTVLVPLATALGHGDVPAQTTGGPLEPDLLAALLAAAPVLRGVWVDPEGVPVADSRVVARPARGDAEDVRRALRRIVAAGPGAHQPRHADDHPSHDHGPPDHDLTEHPRHDPPDLGPPDHPPDHPLDHLPGHPPDRPLRRPRVLLRAHPAGTPGPYRPPASLRRFLQVRSPRCEWPGCGVRASRCDLDHGLAHPSGPTCACNLGPLCRRHHRCKQVGWDVQRTADGLLWTGPTHRQVRAPRQHLDVPCLRAPRPTSALEQLGPRQQLEERWLADPTDPLFDGLDAEHPPAA